MPRPKSATHDDRYFGIIRDALSVCRNYKPKFGKGIKKGLTFEEFQTLYQSDPFYTWFGLDSPMIYAAHKAAGGITSVYRQIGISCERLFREIVQDTLKLSDEEAKWSYSVPSTSGRPRTLSLDARIALSDIANASKAEKVRKWLHEAAASVNVSSQVIGSLAGSVFEVRQGYKSKDAKRQNADLGNAANAYANLYLPTVVLLSSQIDGDIAERYKRAQWVILTGTLRGTSLDSTYRFCREVLGYDLAGFFERNSKRIQEEIGSVTEMLLQ